jgi:NTE family protein
MPPTIEISKQEVSEPLPTPNVSVPKIGLILGPGGARAYAEIGVLRAFERARIPVSMIAGVEWGSLMAALYSMNGKANEIEWEAMKIPNDFVQSSFLSSKVDARSFSDLEKRMRDFFGNKKIENGKVPFSCTTDNIRNMRSLMIFKGTYKDTMGLCLGFPPFLTSNRGWVAAPFQVKYLIDQMAQRGMDYIILVDVLGTANPMAGAKVSEETSVLWAQLSKSMAQNKAFVHQTVEVPLQKSVLDFSARREFIQAGEQAGQQAAQIISQKFGL